MLLSYRPVTDPYLNIAAEEYYIRHSEEEMCMLWINDRSVIIGKHQNAFAEINYPYVVAKKIPVIRRISGGGAVYHDAGNINFSFIRKTSNIRKFNFADFTSIISAFMQSLGIEVTTNKRNSLFIGSLKFSGHAEHIFRDKVLHHGTMLFSSDLNTLNAVLTPAKEFKSKAMASVRSDVGNIAPLLPHHINIHAFVELFTNWLKQYFQISNSFSMDTADYEAIQQLAETKYKTWQWNFGYSPSYSFTIYFQFFSDVLPVTFKVENGKFVEVICESDKENYSFLSVLKNMKGLFHKEEDIAKFVEKYKSDLEQTGIKSVSFARLFFQ